MASEVPDWTPPDQAPELDWRTWDTTSAALAWRTWDAERDPSAPVLQWEMEAPWPPGWSEAGRDSLGTVPPDVAEWTRRLAWDLPMRDGPMTDEWESDRLVPWVFRPGPSRWWLLGGGRELADFADHIRTLPTWQHVRRALHEVERTGRWWPDA